jgi:CRP/FNR family cyclic AMP-dependent transcriptional regulator
MIERFQGNENRNRLIEAIKRQAIVRNDEALADAISNHLELIEFEAEAPIIAQGGYDDDLYLILAGRAAVIVNGREVAIRGAGEHVGEISVIDPTAPRSASVIALEQTVTAKIEEPAFLEMADTFPVLWQRLALQLSQRLRQRNELVVQRNARPVIFVGSSKETLDVAREIQSALRYEDFVLCVWTDNVFGASNFPIDELQKQLQTADFAVLVLGPDDRVISRDKESDAPRDNVIFELGLFMGALGRERTFMILPREMNLKVPSDLLGLTPLDYGAGPPEELATRLAPACNDLRAIIKNRGPR